jgi:hypothetical protein
MNRVVRFNSLLFAVLFLLFVPLYAKNQEPLTARDYFNELVASGGIDRLTKSHACFQDDAKADNFFLIGESKSLREYSLANGTFSRLPKPTQELMRKDFLMVRGYLKGIPWKGEEFLDRDEDSWVSDQRMLDENTPIRVRFNLNLQTLRYKYTVEVLNMDSTYRSEVASSGQCEELPAEVQPHIPD